VKEKGDSDLGRTSEGEGLRTRERESFRWGNSEEPGRRKNADSIDALRKGFGKKRTAVYERRKPIEHDGKNKWGGGGGNFLPFWGKNFPHQKEGQVVVPQGTGKPKEESGRSQRRLEKIPSTSKGVVHGRPKKASTSREKRAQVPTLTPGGSRTGLEGRGGLPGERSICYERGGESVIIAREKRGFLSETERCFARKGESRVWKEGGGE